MIVALLLIAWWLPGIVFIWRTSSLARRKAASVHLSHGRIYDLLDSELSVTDQLLRGTKTQAEYRRAMEQIASAVQVEPASFLAPTTEGSLTEGCTNWPLRLAPPAVIERRHVRRPQSRFRRR